MIFSRFFMCNTLAIFANALGFLRVDLYVDVCEVVRFSRFLLCKRLAIFPIFCILFFSADRMDLRGFFEVSCMVNSR